MKTLWVFLGVILGVLAILVGVFQPPFNSDSVICILSGIMSIITAQSLATKEGKR